MSYAKLLKHIALGSDHPRHRHASLILRGGALLSSATNAGGRHAEVRALMKLWPNKRKGTTVVNIRITAAGAVGISRPCSRCMAVLKEAGVRSVVYTDRKGQWAQEKI